MKLGEQATGRVIDTTKRNQKYVLATSRNWNEGISERLSNHLGVRFDLINRKDQLTVDGLERVKPRYVFFPHWSYIIPEKIFSRYECVIFHMTDLPFGRGGSPLQNLISRGISETMISALRCVRELDAGPIYLKRPLSLHGSAEEIYLRASDVVEEMIEVIIQTEPEPEPQIGQPVVFKRRRPEESVISDHTDLKGLFDHIRMLDAKGYPRAFLEQGGFRFEFSRGMLKQDHVLADVKITRVDDE